MIKKLVLIVFCLCLGFCFGAEIPKEKQAQYKAEIKKYIASKYNPMKTEIDKDFKEAITIYKRFNYNQTEQEIFAIQNALEAKSSSIDSTLFWYYVGLLNITDKYAKVKDSVPPSDYIGDVYDVLQPCFKSAGISTNEVDKIFVYGRSKAIEIENLVSATYKN